MQKYRVNILDAAERDLRKNYQYISEILENEPAAHKILVEIWREIDKLKYMPRAHKIYEGPSVLECRMLRVRQYLIFYAIDDDTGIVNIIRVYHSHMNPENIKL